MTSLIQISFMIYDWQREAGVKRVKRIKKNIILEKIVFGYPHESKEKGKGSFWESHKIIKNDTILEKPDWEWCEYRFDTIYFTQKGCLYELKDIKLKPKLIYDFNDEKFVCNVAPY